MQRSVVNFSLHEVTNTAKNEDARAKSDLKNNEKWKQPAFLKVRIRRLEIISYLFTLAGGIPIGICTAFYEHGFHMFVAMFCCGILFAVIAGFSFWLKQVYVVIYKDVTERASRKAAAKKEQGKRIRRVVDAYMLFSRTPKYENEDRLNVLLAAGGISLQSLGEYKDALEEIRKRGETVPVIMLGGLMDASIMLQGLIDNPQPLTSFAELAGFLLSQFDENNPQNPSTVPSPEPPDELKNYKPIEPDWKPAGKNAP